MTVLLLPSSVYSHTISPSLVTSSICALDYFDNYDDIQGDINGDGILNILDIVSLVNLVLSNNYESSGDINGDGILNILDIVLLANFILGG
jgi:hypothetical protein